jgi:CBS domain-containing protein
MKSRDRQKAPLSNIFATGDAIHSVGPGTAVSECARMMSGERIGALVVLEGGQLKGIFTERDALNRVLAAGLDPRVTKVSDVMTRDPFCMTPTQTVGDAMGVITRRRFRHLPIIENGSLLAVISSGDLTRWMLGDQVGEVQELVGLAARS